MGGRGVGKEVAYNSPATPATGNEGQRGGFRISVFETWYTPLDGAAQLPSDVL